MNKNIKDRCIQLYLLIKDLEGIVEYVYGDLKREINSIEYNSKNVTYNTLFIAIPGFVNDGHNFVKEAVNKGARAIVISQERITDFSDLRERGVTILASRDTRRALSKLSASFYSYPTSDIPVIGITGTNGKTSITYMLESILRCYGYSPGVIGTVNYRWRDREIHYTNTTPESRDLHEMFFKMISNGVDALIMEVSSHALKLSRVDDIDFDMVVFTNLTRDHLDFHETFEDYFDSKRRIFNILQSSCKEKKSAVVNIDDEFGRIILNEERDYTYPMFSVGVNTDADYQVKVESIRNSIDGLSFTLEKPERITIELNIAGRFHIHNSLCAFAVSHLMGIPVEIIQKGLSDIYAIPGRFDRIKSRLGFNVIVDYAHTDDALSQLLKSARELHPKRIITLFGCGGNRDKTKRPLMGRAAVDSSDWVIVTSDNPREENPDNIINDIIDGLDSTNYEIQSDREKAIKRAIDMAERDDMIVIAGKGHENYQLIGGMRIDFDDSEVARKYISEKELS